MMRLAFPKLWRLVSVSILLIGIACASNQPKPEEKPVASTTPIDDGGAPPPEEADAGTSDISDLDADGGLDEDAQAAARAAKEKAKADAEKKEKDAAEKAAAEKLKVIQDQITGEFTEAFKSIKAGNDDEAIAKYQQVLHEHPEAFAAHYNLGVIYERKGESDKAQAEYRKSLDLKADFDPASDNLTRLYLRSGQAEKAETELKQRIQAHPRNLAFRNQLVRVLMAENHTDQAESDCKKILKIDERNVDAMLNLALIWYGEKKFELAKQVLESARDILDKPNEGEAANTDPYAPAVWNLLAFTQLNLDQRTLALESFRRAAELRPDYPEAHNNYGAMLNEVNDCDNAIRELELAVRYAPGYAEAHLNLGNAYRCGHKYKEAQAEYDKALMLNPKSLDPVFNTAILYLDGFDMKVDYNTSSVFDSEKLERLKKAIAYFDKFKDAGGQDDRFDRYYQEAEKAEGAEQKRLEREKDRSAKEMERRKKDEERKRIADEKAKADAVKHRAWVKQYRVSEKADIEDAEPASAPAPAATTVSPPAAAPQPEAPPAATLRPPKRSMEKVGRKEDL